jgi:hypothetical protein
LNITESNITLSVANSENNSVVIESREFNVVTLLSNINSISKTENLDRNENGNSQDFPTLISVYTGFLPYF